MVPHNVIETTSETFSDDVIRRSYATPVVVDFWASWCSPCLVLGPILEKVVAERAGSVVLAKVDVEAFPDLAEEYGVSGIPMVKLFVEGRVSAEFSGALPESHVREFLERAVPTAGAELVARARELKEMGKLDEAESLAREVLDKDPGDQGAIEIVATAAMVAGRVDEALELINSMETPTKDTRFLAEGAEFWRMCAEAAASEKTLTAPPEDLEGRMASAACLASQGEYSRALNVLLDIVKRDKSFRDGLARRAMVSIFVVMGLSSALVREYQSRLAQLLF